MPLTLSQKAAQVAPSTTLAITAKAKELKAQGVDVVAFTAGEPDFNTPDYIAAAAIQAIREGFTKYTPASGTIELKKAIAHKFHTFNNLHYTPEQIVVSNGGKHSLTNVFQALLNPGDEVLILTPFWLSYPEIIKLFNGVPVFVEGLKENDYKATAEQIAKAVTSKTKALILNSPSNPTGMVYTKAELEAIAQVAIDHDFYIVSDEMYENLCYDDVQHISIASLSQAAYDRTITCSGVSKAYAMTGWRIGYTGSSKEIAKIMGAIQSHETSNPSSISQRAATEALLGNQTEVEMMKEAFGKRRDELFKRIQAMPYIHAIKPQGAFYLFVDVSEVLTMTYHGETIGTSNHLAEILIEEAGLSVIPCEDFGAPKHIRLSYAISNKAIEKGCDRLEHFLRHQLQA